MHMHSFRDDRNCEGGGNRGRDFDEIQMGFSLAVDAEAGQASGKACSPDQRQESKCPSILSRKDQVCCCDLATGATAARVICLMAGVQPRGEARIVRIVRMKGRLPAGFVSGYRACLSRLQADQSSTPFFVVMPMIMSSRSPPVLLNECCSLSNTGTASPLWIGAVSPATVTSPAPFST